MKIKFSLWAQLLLWVLIPVTLLRFGSGLYILELNRKALNAAYDDSLVDTLRGLSTRIEVRDGRLHFDLPPEAAEVFSAVGEDRLFFQITGPDGAILGGEPDFIPLAPHAQRLQLSSGVYRGEKLRVASLRMNVSTPAGPQEVYVRAGETVGGRVAAATESDERLVSQQLLMVFLVTVAVLVGVRRALRPLSSIREELAQRSLSDLRPLNVEAAPAEIVPLLETINQLLGHLRADIEIQQRFVSNAAHQLRTPLAGLKTSAELALRESTVSGTREMVAQILEGANRSVHLVKQLLAISRAEPKHGREILFTDVDLASLAREVCKAYLGVALKKNIDLGYEGPGSLIVRGEATCLREMIGNLVDNAVRYSSSGGVVTVHLASGKEIGLSVEDSGPGIPRKERDRVFERFYRVLGTGEDGTGLGLSIVKEVVQMHGGKISLSDGEGGIGTRVTVVFPGAILTDSYLAFPRSTAKIVNNRGAHGA